MFWNTEKPKPKRPKPAPVKREPTPYELTLDAVKTGEIMECGPSQNIPWVVCRKHGMDVYVSCYNHSGDCSELKAGKAKLVENGRYRPADKRTITFGERADDTIANAAYARIKEYSGRIVREATSDFFEGMGNG